MQQNSTILRTLRFDKQKGPHHHAQDTEQELADYLVWAKSSSHLFLFCIFFKGYSK